MNKDIIKESLEVQLPTIWTVEKAEQSSVESEDEKQRRSRVRRKKIQSRKMLGKSRNAVFFQ